MHVIGVIVDLAGDVIGAAALVHRAATHAAFVSRATGLTGADTSLTETAAKFT